MMDGVRITMWVRSEKKTVSDILTGGRCRYVKFKLFFLETKFKYRAGVQILYSCEENTRYCSIWCETAKVKLSDTVQ
jgi:hypothetical protein